MKPFFYLLAALAFLPATASATNRLEEGRAVYNALLPRIAAINRELLSVLAPAEVEVLDGLLRRLNAQALRVGAVGDDVVPKFE